MAIQSVVRQLPARQRLRRALLLISLLLFPITLYYFSPVLIMQAASEGVVNASFIVFAAMFVSSLFVGRLWCGWACPAGALQEVAGPANNRPVSRRIDWIKMAADILFFAGDIRDRYLSARWKTFFDRSFFRGHAPSLAGKQVGWIIAGPLRQLPSLRQILEAYLEVQAANLLGIVTDEYAESHQIDALLDDLAVRAVAWASGGHLRPVTFLGVGGHKLFRDAIWGDLRFVFQADHRHYRQIGYYDFPQRKMGTRLLNLVAPLIRLPFVRKRFVPRVKEAMIMPFRRMLDEA